MPMPALDDKPPELSKTRKKRAMEALQALGERLATLPAERLKKIDLPEDLREAIDAVRRMSRQDEARRRQMQYIGRLMRHTDSEPIRAALAEP
jgi:ribosome-associated protein